MTSGQACGGRFGAQGKRSDDHGRGRRWKRDTLLVSKILERRQLRHHRPIHPPRVTANGIRADYFFSAR